MGSSRSISKLFEEALLLPREERAGFIDRACKGDSALRAELERLLKAHDEASPQGFLNHPAVAWGASTETVFPAVFTPGQKIADRYVIVRLVGEGGMGQVYEAHDEVLVRPVALKTIRSPLADKLSIERFKKEVKLAQQVAHENVCRVFDIEHRNQPPFLTMEFIQGETLSARLNRAEGGRLSTAEALPIIHQIAQGLDAAHRKAVIHGDFKPGNVMLVATAGGNGLVKITDFGLARTPEGDSTIGATHPAGTPPYMAPEQLLGSKATVASDIYAVGLVMYEMVTGGRPQFDRMNEEPPPPSRLVPGLQSSWDAAILGCLAFQPSARFRSSLDAYARIQDTPQHQPISRRVVFQTAISAASMSLFGDPIRVERGKAKSDRDLPVSPSRPIKEGSSVLLTDVQNLTQDPELDAVTELLRSQLGQSPRFNLTERGRIAEILRQMVRSPSQKLDGSTAREVAWREGAPAVVFGSVSRLAKDYSLDLEIEEIWGRPDIPAATWSRSWTASKAGLFSAIHDGSSWVRMKIGEASDEIASANLTPEESTTKSWEALKLYTDAEKLKANDKAEEAIVLLQEAVEHDPQFSLALMRLGDLSLSVYRERDGLNYWARAIATLQYRRVTLREELRIRGLFATDRGDFTSAENFFRRLAVHYPNDYLPFFYLASCLARLGRVEEALDLYGEAQRLRPAAYYVPAHLGGAYLLLGKLDQVQPFITRLRALGHEDPALFLEGAVHFLRNEFDKTQDRFQKIEDSASGEWQSRAYSLQACLASERGKYQDATRTLERGLSFDVAKGKPPMRADKLLALAYIHYRTGDRAACRSACKDAVGLEQGPDRLRRAGALLARAGFAADAEPLLRQLQAMPQYPKSRIAVLHVTGEIELARGDRAKALQQLQQAHQLEPVTVPREYLARAFAVAGEAGRAVPLLLDTLKSPGRIWQQPDLEFPGLLADSFDAYQQLSKQLGQSPEPALETRYGPLRRDARPGIDHAIL